MGYGLVINAIFILFVDKIDPERPIENKGDNTQSHFTTQTENW